MIKVARLAATLLIALSAGVAQARPVTFGFDGGLGECFGCPPEFPFSVAISGSYTFDSEAPDLAPSDPVEGIYGPVAFRFEILGSTFEGSNAVIRVLNDHLSGASEISNFTDGYYLFGFGPAAGSGAMSFLLRDCSGETLDSDALPITPPDLQAFRPNCEPNLGRTELFVSFSLSPSSAPFFFGNLSSLYLVPELVPEPATLALLGIALAGLGFARRRKVN